MQGRVVVCSEDTSINTNPYYDFYLPPRLSWLKDFMTLVHADHILISRSTFGIWASWLSKARIYVANYSKSDLFNKNGRTFAKVKNFIENDFSFIKKEH